MNFVVGFTHCQSRYHLTFARGTAWGRDPNIVLPLRYLQWRHCLSSETEHNPHHTERNLSGVFQPITDAMHTFGNIKTCFKKCT